MADILSPEDRSSRMRKIKNKDTSPEIRIRKILHRKGFRYIKNSRKLPGTPDIALPKYKTVIFVHGCFWHRHEKCTRVSIPKTNKEYWDQKFKKNIERDKRAELELRSMGWKVYIIWECQLKSQKKAELVGEKIETALKLGRYSPDS